VRGEFLECALVARQVGELRGSLTPTVRYFTKCQSQLHCTRFQKYAYPEHTIIVIVDRPFLLEVTGVKRP
jgi:hypothetical protein